MYTIQYRSGLFSLPGSKDFYRDSQKIGHYDDKNGLRLTVTRHMELRGMGEPVKLTRSQGWKYWLKYFPGRNYWTLPAEIRAAVDREATREVCYVNKKGEIIHHMS